MKRSEALKLIAAQLEFIQGTFEGLRDEYSKKELKNADVILTTLEHAGMLPPFSLCNEAYLTQTKYSKETVISLKTIWDSE